MNAGEAVGYLLVPLFGIVLVLAPLTTRRTVQFGVRVPPAQLTNPILGRARRGYFVSSAVVAVCALVILIIVGGTPAWYSRVILLGQILADFGCYWWAHRRVEKVKAAEGWFAGQRQTVVADTSWRTQPQRFPIAWLVPALTVIVATLVIGVLRYPHLPARLDENGKEVAKSVARVFAVLVAQVYVTGLGSGLLVLVHHARPDLDTADPAASLRGYRKALGAVARAALILLACVDLTLLLAGLQQWQVIAVPGVLVLLPVVLGMVGLFGTVVRVGRQRARTAVAAGARDRDDDRFWKGGLVYVNRDDPALMVGARFAFGWTLNMGNPAAWLVLGGVVGLALSLVIVRLVTGAV